MWPCTLPSVKALVILDAEGSRLAAKYYDTEWYGDYDLYKKMTIDFSRRKSSQKQQEFERTIYSKTLVSSNSELEAFVLENNLVVYRTALDFQVYVIASNIENEMIVSSVLLAFYSALSLLTGGIMEKHVLLEHFDVCMLAFDEIVDDGVILEIDPDSIYQRVSLREFESDALGADNPLAQAFATAREQLSKNLLR